MAFGEREALGSAGASPAGFGAPPDLSRGLGAWGSEKAASPVRPMSPARRRRLRAGRPRYPALRAHLPCFIQSLHFERWY